MLRIGVIGTGSIVREMIQAVEQVEEIEITCLYSRTMEHAMSFAKANNLTDVKLTTDFNDMMSVIDAVYIASPNGLHFTQAHYFLSHCKHVMLEKPMCFSTSEVDQLATLALANKVMIMEAFKPIYLPNYATLAAEVKRVKPVLASLQWNKYSSRMPLVRQGIYNSVFDEEIGRGSVYDALIYPVELAISLFGPVIRVMSMSQLLPNGVSANDTVMIAHKSQVITSIVSAKSVDGFAESEIMGPDESITFSHLTHLQGIRLHKRIDQASVLCFDNKSKYPMMHEFVFFTNMIATNNVAAMQEKLALTRAAINVLEWAIKEGMKLRFEI